MTVALHEAIQEFITRIDYSIERMHDAIYSADIDEQLAGLAAIVGLVEMLKSAADDPEAHKE